MARRDIAGLLTGIPSSGGGSFAEVMTQGARQMGGLMGRYARGAVTGDSRSNEQRLADSIKNFDSATPEAQKDLIGRLQASGESSVAAQLLGQLKADAQKVKTESNEKTFSTYLKDKYPNSGLDKLADEGIVTPQNLSTFLSKQENKKIVNLVNTKTNKTVGTATEVDGQLFNSQGQLMSPEELEGFGVSASYVKPSTPLVSTAADPRLKAEAERRANLFTPLDTIAESTAVNAESAVNEKRNAQTALRAIDNNAKTGAISAVSFDLAQIGQDVFQNLGIQVPQGWSKLTNSKAQYQMISAQGLLPRIEEQGRGFTDTEREYFLKEVIPSYKQAWQFNELASHLQDESATLKIAEAGFANNRRAWHVSEDKTPTQAHAVVWDDYTSKLPYNKLKKNAKRMVGTKEVIYDKYQTLSDKNKLWQYWSSGQEPTGFTLIDAEGNPIDYTFYELNNLEGFEGKTAREILQLFGDADRLSGAIYK